MHHDNAHAVVGGLAVTGLLLGVIVTMEPTSRLVHIPLPVPVRTVTAPAPAKYLLMDTSAAIVMDPTRRRW